MVVVLPHVTPWTSGMVIFGSMVAEETLSFIRSIMVGQTLLPIIIGYVVIFMQMDILS